MPIEVFKPLKHKGTTISGYEVSNLGRVKSLERDIFYNGKNQFGSVFPVKKHITEKILIQKRDRGGYLYVNIPITHGVIKSLKVHRMVAETFLKSVDGKFFVNHKDENKENNHFDNLEWVNMYENNAYGSRAEKFIKVAKYDMNGNLLGEYPTLRAAGRSVVKPNGKTGEDNRVAIKKCCDGKIKSSIGYIWKYL